MTSAAVPNDSRDLSALARDAVAAARAYQAEAMRRVRTRVLAEGRVSGKKLEAEQHAAHALAWIATYVKAIEESAASAERLIEAGQFGEIESLLARIGLGEYLDQLFTALPMSQGETARPSSVGLSAREAASLRNDAVETLIATGNNAANRAALAGLLAANEGGAMLGASGLDDTLDLMRDEIRRFGEGEVAPHAHGWHLRNEYIPLEVIAKMAELGVFGLTIPEEFGGLALSKVSMCVVSEELSRAYVGVGSLGTRSEIAAELILAGGTEDQKARFLPKLTSGETLAAAVFTEPNTGSDLGALRTRAVREGDVYRVYGNKTWITHPVRSDLMMLLVRTDPNQADYKGLSMLLAEKPRGSDADPFPVAGLTGSEIEVLGYRGMKEYELSFDGFEVPAENLLGGFEGQGFYQLMQTFEAARIQTAARALGVAQSALDLGLRYARERIQFGKPLLAFPRVADKLAMMAVEIHLARQLTYHSARAKDEGKRCDLEAGMAKLLAARVAFAAADNALQIHGGNGYALEYPISRVFNDARVLSIFEGAAEVQAQVIARRLLEGAN